jgi:hypothetical protein
MKSIFMVLATIVLALAPQKACEQKPESSNRSEKPADQEKNREETTRIRSLSTEFGIKESIAIAD